MTLSRGLLLKIGGGVVAGVGGIASTVFGTSGGSKANNAPLSQATEVKNVEAPSLAEKDGGAVVQEKGQEGVSNPDEAQNQSQLAGDVGGRQPGSASQGKSDVSSGDTTGKASPGTPGEPNVDNGVNMPNTSDQKSVGGGGTEDPSSGTSEQVENPQTTQHSPSLPAESPAAHDGEQEESSPSTLPTVNSADPQQGNDTQITSDSVNQPSSEDTVSQPPQEQTEVEKINKKLEEVKMPSECKFADENTRTIECSLDTQDKLDEVVFQDDENGTNEDIKGDIKEFKVRILWLKEDQKNDYSPEKQDLIFTFLGTKKEDIEIGDSITFKKEIEKDYVITEGLGNNEKKLKELWGGPQDLAQMVGLKPMGNSEYAFKKDGEQEIKFKFSKDGGKTIQEITPSSVPTGKFKSEDEEEGFNQGFKYILKEKITGDNGVVLETGDYEIKYDVNQSTWYLSSKTPSNPTVVSSSSPVSSTSTLPTPNSSTTLNSQKITELNGKLQTLNLPEGCRFTEGQTGNSFECSISKGSDFQGINFEGDEDGGEEEINDEDIAGLKLKVEYLDDAKKANYGDLEENLLFTFSNFGETKTTIDHVEVNGELILYKGTNQEFEMDEGELRPYWNTISKLAEKVGLKNCNSTCTLEAGSILKYSDDKGATIKNLNVSADVKNGITSTDETEKFNQGFKFTFNGQTTIDNVILEAGNYEIKYKDADNGGWYLVKHEASSN